MYSATGEGDILSSSTTVHPCRRFSLEEIRFATKDFDDDLVIGQGGFGKVYKGQLSTEQPGHVVAIKRLNCMSDQGEHEFRAEIETLTKLRHCHLVSLIGYCDDNREMILVYEYMLNGTLYHHLHEAGTSLNWVQRMKIAIGAGRGLDYLHTGVGTTHGIIHRDVKSSNILLNENMTAMISDFGLSKIGQINQSSSWMDASVKGTFGYLDPEYFYTKKLSRKTDVYAFGVVLFELLTGRRAVDENREEEQCSLVRWAKKCVKERKLDQMVDSNIKGTISPKCLRRFTQTADRCVDSIPKERPTMTEVVASLQAILELQLKSDNSTKSSGKIGFIWKFPKYLNIVTKQNSGQSSTSSSTKWHGSFHDEWTHHQSVTKVLGGIKEFTYEELTHATGNFQETCLGNRIDGDVYKGWLDKLTYAPSNPSSGLPVEVERYHLGEGDYIQHMRLCGAYPHPNLYGPIGYCIEGEERFFVYESMHNGDFEDLLCSGVVATLPLIKKVKIAFGVARGILFYDKIPYPERLLERRDIMLDKDFTARLLYCRAIYESSQPNSPGRSEYLDAYSSSSPKGESLRMDISGFTVIFAEVVTGRRVFSERELDILDDKLLQHGKQSVRQIAGLCFTSCYTAESELQMLEFLKEYDKIPASQDEKLLYKATLDDCEDETFYTTTFNRCEDDTLYIESLEECGEETFSTTSYESCL